MSENTRTTPRLWARLCSTLNTLSTTEGTQISSVIFRLYNAVAATLSSRLSFFFHRRRTTRFNQAIAFIIPALITFLQLKTQNNDKNPFSTHPSTMRISIVSFLIYYAAFFLQLRFDLLHFYPPFAVNLVQHLVVFSGNLSVASLASLFFPDSVRPFLYVFSAVISVSEFLQRAYRRIVERWRERELYIYNTREERFFDRLWRVYYQNLFLGRAQLLPR